MKHINKYVFSLTICIAVLLFAVAGWAIGRAAISSTQSASAQQEPPSLIATPENLQDLGLSFELVASADPLAQGTITQEQAVATALREMPDLKATTGVAASLGFLSSPELQRAASDGVAVDARLAGPTLVWAVTFHGIESLSSGQPGQPRRSAPALTVVIDGKTDEFIVAFPISDLTQK
jgi:hypothetical protein